MHLTAEQQAIVDFGRGAAVVAAVAGSGKTTCLKLRVRNLVRSGTFPASQILCTTFNRQNQEDIEKALAPFPECRGVEVRTLNGLGDRIISQAVRMGHAKTSSEVVALTSRHFYDALRLARAAGASYLEETWDADPEEFLDWVEGCRNTMAYPDLPQTSLAAEARAKARQAVPPEHAAWFLDLWQILERDLAQHGVITYTDQLRIAWELLHAHPDLLQVLQKRWQCLIVDEYQDVNALQVDILDLLARSHGNYMAIGDDDQTIYSFRGADSSFMLTFQERYNARLLAIQSNFRCHAEQLAVANHLIRKNRDRLPKSLRLTRGFAGRVVLEAPAPAQGAARRLLQRVGDHASSGTPLLQQMVLVRNWIHAGMVEALLAGGDVPYELPAGKSFASTPESRMLQTWAHLLRLEALHQVGEPLSAGVVAAVRETFAVQMRATNRYLPRAVLAQMADGLSTEAPSALFLRHAASVHETTRPFMVQVAEFLRAWAALCGTRPAGEVIEAWRRATAFKELVERNQALTRDGKVGRIAALAAIQAYSARFATFAQAMSALETFNPPNRTDTGDRLRITTLHRSKGLEWPVVHLYGVSQGQFPSEREGTSREEERRLFYVALTRSLRDTHIYADEEPSTFLSGFEEVLEEVRPAAALLVQEPNLDVKATCQALQAVDKYDWQGYLLSPQAPHGAAWVSHFAGLTTASAAFNAGKALGLPNDASWIGTPSSLVDYTEAVKRYIVEFNKGKPRGYHIPLSAPALQTSTAECPDYPKGSVWLLQEKKCTVVEVHAGVQDKHELRLADEMGNVTSVYCHQAKHRLNSLST